MTTVESLPLSGKAGLYYYSDINLLTLDGNGKRYQNAISEFSKTLNQYFLGLRKLRFLREAGQAPRTLFVEPWRTCNLACTYCYAHADSSHRKKLDVGSLKTLMNRYKFTSVLVFGGDPLLDSQFLLDLYHAQEWESFFFSTNGILFNQKSALDLIGLPKVSFQISFEPNEWAFRVTKKGEHQLDLLLPSLRLLKNRKLDFRITIPPEAPYVSIKSVVDRLAEVVAGRVRLP